MGYTWDNDGQYCEQKSAHENHSENNFLPIGLMQWKRLLSRMWETGTLRSLLLSLLRSVPCDPATSQWGVIPRDNLTVCTGKQTTCSISWEKTLLPISVFSNQRKEEVWDSQRWNSQQ